MQTKLFLQGISEFNATRFFEAHELLEDVWRGAAEPERRFFQGLIQVAVALHHHSRQNIVGCKSVMRRARKNLSLYPPEHRGVDLVSLRESLDGWLTALEGERQTPPLPVIKFKPDTVHGKSR